MPDQAYRVTFYSRDEIGPLKLKSCDFRSAAPDVATLKQEAWDRCSLQGAQEDWEFRAAPIRFLTVQDVLESADLKEDTRDRVDSLVEDILSISEGPSSEICGQFGLSMKSMDFAKDQMSYSVLYLHGAPVALRITDFDGDGEEVYDISPIRMQELSDFVSLWKRSNEPAPEPARDPATFMLRNKWI